MFIFGYTQVINNKLYIVYILVNEVATSNNINNNRGFYKFSTGFNPDYIISNFTNDFESCQTSCSLNSECLGVFNYFIDDKSYCNTLSNLGDTSTTNINCLSYRKVFKYTQNNNHSIKGYSFETYEYYGETYNYTQKTKLYLDINHNGVWDIDEPYNCVLMIVLNLIIYHKVYICYDKK